MTDPADARAKRLRRESSGFLIGSALFGVGAVPAHATAAGPLGSALTFFVGSLFFTLGGFIQFALSGRRPPRGRWRSADAADWWSALIQFMGTVLFNVSTVTVLVAAVPATPGTFSGWRLDVWGSAAFLVSSILAMVAANRRHELWDPLARTWHGTILNMLGSIAFAFSAVGAFVVPATGAVLSEFWANGGTFVGAICFFVAALLARRFIPQDAPAR
ncbi:YrhK family protein [Microbacterium sp.]|uniref:YrhK family protein n=1 Tax=Microbacterium sp. TaxID=51671 RepID=UPI0026309402|nr:YrhK family protein [Microbacterium sp.]